MVKKQIQTERGLICVDATFVSPEAAEKAGYSYTFTSRKYGDFARFMYSIKILNLGRDYGNKEKDNTLKRRGCTGSRGIP